MLFKKIFYYLVLIAVIFSAFNFFKSKETGTETDRNTKQELVKNWPSLSEEITLGNTIGLGIDTNQNIVVFHKSERKWPLQGAMPVNYIKTKTIFISDKNLEK